MAEQAFQRQVVVQLGTEGGAGVSFSGLRVQARVKKTRSGSPNEATISIWNLTPDSVRLIQQPNAAIRLLAGYDVPRLLFVGSPVPHGTELAHEGPDRVLTVTAQDGGRALRETQVSLSTASKTTLQQVYELLTAQFSKQLAVGAAALQQGTVRLPTGADAITYPDGITLHGTARDVLGRLAEAHNCEWWVNDGAINFVGSGDDIGDTAVVFSVAGKNLIGSPRQRDDNGIEFTGLLDAAVRPGTLCKVESEQINGVYVAHDVEFTLDSGFSNEFYVTVTGYPPGGGPAKTSAASSPATTTATTPASGADSPNLDDILADLDRAIRAGLRCHLPAIVTGYDQARQTCSAQIMIRAKVQQPDGSIGEQPYPPIYNVPVLHLGGAGGSLVFDVMAGDEVILMFADRAIDEWKAQASGMVSARDPRLHNITDAWAMPAGRRPANALDATHYATGAGVLFGGDLRLGSSAATSPVVLWTLLNAYLGALKTWLDTHIHTSTGVFAPTTPPTIPSPVVSSSASSNVKSL